MNGAQYLYLLQTREFINSGKPIYKVGRTTQENLKRLNQYPKDSRLCEDKREDTSDNEKQDDEVAPYIITTHEEWIKHTNISKIQVTNKNGEGYLRFKGELWRNLHDKTCFDFDETCMEYLSEFVEKNQPFVSKMISPNDILVSEREMFNMKYTYEHKVSNEVITFDEYNKLDKNERECYKSVNHNEYKFNCDVRFDVSKITQDTIKKCFVKKCDFYNLEYHEYTLATSRPGPDVIFNSVNFTFTPVDDLLDNNILTGNGSCGRIIDVKTTVNVKIVDDILNSLIVDKKITLEFKKLAYNLIVRHGEKQVFHDYNDYLLIEWIICLLDSISSKRLYAYSSEYYDNKTKFKKEMKTHKYRLVMIHAYQNITFEKQIEDFSKLGFKNIIVCKKDKTNTMYNVANFRNYLKDNSEMIMKCIKEENNYEPTRWETEIQHDDNIFRKNNLLFMNFLKWCCVN